MGLEFGECHFDRVQVWRIGGQEQEPALLPFQQVRGLEALVGGQIVEDDDGAGLKDGGKPGFDAGGEGGAIHRGLDHPRGDQCATGQTRDEGLGLPFPERRDAEQAVAPNATPAQAGHVGLLCDFINEHKAIMNTRR